MKLCIISLLTIFIVLTLLHGKSIATKYDDCQNPFTCGNISVGYPFRGDGQPKFCGHPGFNLTCEKNISYIDIKGLRFRVLDIDPKSHRMRIARLDLWEGQCVQNRYGDTTLDFSILEYVDHVNQNLTLFYGCSDFFNISKLKLFNCSGGGIDTGNFYVLDSFLNEILGLSDECYKKSVKVPILIKISMELSVSKGLQETLNGGFAVEYSKIGSNCDPCKASDKVCIFDDNKFSCEARTKYSSGQKAQNSAHGMRVGIGLSAGFAGALVTILGFCFYMRHQKKLLKTKSLLLSRNISFDPSSKICKENGDASFGFGVQVFTYEELEKATNSFAANRELGDGGFGTVYYGKIKDGRAVAVKRLYENNYKRVEQFMNEVNLLARLRHKNLVSLYGCTSRHSQELLLVYEYIPNGTLADHIHAKPGTSLSWRVRLNIAIETANALTYLHNSDIIHRDVKSNNILLDTDFNVKVADFGLSRLFPINATHVTTGPQGTPGYVDPEYHQCYQLTDKSDVFSFGVVLIELISSLPAVDVTRNRREINLSAMAINKIQNNKLRELVDPTLGFGSEISEVAECAFRCLQNEKDMRPSMAEVFEILQRIKNSDFDESEKKLVRSPVSVTAEWVSRATTPNDSGLSTTL